MNDRIVQTGLDFVEKSPAENPSSTEKLCKSSGTHLNKDFLGAQPQRTVSQPTDICLQGKLYIEEVQALNTFGI